MAKSYAITNLIPEHFAEVKSRKEAMLDKTAKAVKDRMTAEIQYWDYRASELQQKEAAGKTNSKLNSKLASRRADDLTARMQARLEEIAKERRTSPMPPVVTGGALIIPMGLLRNLMELALRPPLAPATGRQWNTRRWMQSYKSKRLLAIGPRMSARQNAAMMWNPMCRKECVSA